MANTNPLDDLVQRVIQSLPQSLTGLREDMEKNLRSALRINLQKMDLVTREEFEVQKAVLEHTRELLKTLEAKIAELEQQG